MAINFLIALATALGSATLLLLALRLVLKVVAPNAFKEMIPISEKAVERQPPVRMRWAVDWGPVPSVRPILMQEQQAVTFLNYKAQSTENVDRELWKKLRDAERPSAGATRPSAQSDQLGHYVM
jgi:hypothetical protein